MKAKIRRMTLLFFGFIFAWYALWFMLYAFFAGTYIQGGLHGGIASILMILSSLFFAIGLSLEEPVVE